MSAPLAHIGETGEERALLDHLHAVAHRAAQASAGWQSASWAHMAGLWHDLGKYRPGFQQYIRQVNDAHIVSTQSGLTHRVTSVIGLKRNASKCLRRERRRRLRFLG